jgi:hypothetical protein
MANRISYRLNLGRRLLLAVVAIMALTTGRDAGSASRSGAQSLAGSHAAAFEVASIRPNSVWKAGGEGNSRSKIEFTPDRLTMRNVDLSECIQWAYGVQFYRISGLNSLKPDRYEIFAKAEGPVPVGQLRHLAMVLSSAGYCRRRRGGGRIRGELGSLFADLMSSSGLQRLSSPRTTPK